MPKTHVSRAIEIQAAPAEVYARIADFQQWPAWSPWLVIDPDAELKFDPDGNAYSWQGELLGEGIITKISTEKEQSLICLLEIRKPWRSLSEVAFDLEPGPNGGTLIHWRMDGKLPLFLFLMKPMMEALVGMDYERGLTMLKDLCELGEVPNRIELKGQESFPGCRFVGITTECEMAEIGPRMQADFQKLETQIPDCRAVADQVPFTLYHEWDMREKKTRYTVGFPVDSYPENLPEGFEKGEVPASPVVVIEHTGPYRHLGNAWSLGMMLNRSGKIKARKGSVPFERYMNDPRNTDEKDWKVRLCFPTAN